MILKGSSSIPAILLLVQRCTSCKADTVAFIFELEIVPASTALVTQYIGEFKLAIDSA